MPTGPGTRRTCLVVALLAGTLAAAPGWAQDERFQLKLGPTYDQGDFGTSETTRTLFLPLTLKFLHEKFDVGVTAGWLRVETSGGITILDGTPTPTGQARTGRRTDSGISDIYLKGRYFLLEDPGLPSALPSLTPFLKDEVRALDARIGTIESTVRDLGESLAQVLGRLDEQSRPRGER